MNRTVTNSELEINRSYKGTPGRRSQDRRATVTRATAGLNSGGIDSCLTKGSGKLPSSGNNLNAFQSAGSMDYSEKCSRKFDKRSHYFGVRWTFVFDPAGRLSYYWHMVVSIAFLYNLWVIIFRFAFSEINRKYRSSFFYRSYIGKICSFIMIIISFLISILQAI